VTLRGILRVVSALMLVAGALVYDPQVAAQLFHSSLYEEEVKGDLDEAIKVDKRNFEDFATDRSAVAETLLSGAEVTRKED
jgi:hypothetical protein